MYCVAMHKKYVVTAHGIEDLDKKRQLSPDNK